MKKWIMAVAAVLLICMIPVRGFAKEDRVVLSAGEWEYYQNKDGTATICGWHGNEEVLAIPEELDGLRVTGIGENAFDNCSGLTGITIPDSVTKIGEKAFNHCYKLTSITIPKSVTKIGAGAFSGCSLTSFDVSPENEYFEVTDNVLFEKKTKTLISYPGGLDDSSYSVPEGTKKIGDYAFMYCTKLTSIEIPDSVTEIGDHALSSCFGLTSIEIPGSVTEIGERAFSYCSGLTKISIPKSVKKIGKDAFDGCAKVTVSVEKDSYAEQYVKENQIPYTNF